MRWMADLIIGRQPVIYCLGRYPESGETLAHRGVLVLAARNPCAAMQIHQERTFAAFGGQVDVETPLPVAGGSIVQALVDQTQSGNSPSKPSWGGPCIIMRLPPSHSTVRSPPGR